MYAIAEQLIGALDARAIRYCHWKSNINLERALAGHDDLDLLIGPVDEESAFAALAELGFVEASGRGAVHTYTVIHHPKFPGYDFPIVAALVDLEEGPRMVSNVVGCKPESVHVGMAVEAFIHEDEDGFKLPLFRPASD